MKIPSLEETEHALALVGEYSIRPADSHAWQWEVLNKRNEHVGFFQNLGSVWIMINQKIAWHLNEFHSGQILLELFRDADEATHNEIALNISKYWISLDAHDYIENLIESLTPLTIDPDSIPDDWEQILLSIQSTGRLGLTVPAQFEHELGMSVVGIN